MTSARLSTWVRGLPSTNTCSGWAAIPSLAGSALMVQTVQKRTMSLPVDHFPSPPAFQLLGTSAPVRTGLAPSAALMVTPLSTASSPSR